MSLEDISADAWAILIAIGIIVIGWILAALGKDDSDLD